MEHIKAILEGILSRGKLRAGVSDHGFFARWNEIVGDHLAGETRPLRVSGGVLWIYVANATLQHHLSYMAPKILSNIRERAPEARIKNIRFTLNPEQ